MANDSTVKDRAEDWAVDCLKVPRLSELKYDDPRWRSWESHLAEAFRSFAAKELGDLATWAEKWAEGPVGKEFAYGVRHVAREARRQAALEEPQPEARESSLTLSDVRQGMEDYEEELFGDKP